jgi:hypothetical protein
VLGDERCRVVVSTHASLLQVSAAEFTETLAAARIAAVKSRPGMVRCGGTGAAEVGRAGGVPGIIPTTGALSFTKSLKSSPYFGEDGRSRSTPRCGELSFSCGNSRMPRPAGLKAGYSGGGDEQH